VKSLISEFSYGFALTHELVIALGSLSAAPIFPSLIEEGRSGGGYDVKLEAPGIPLFLQFKRSDCMMLRNAREIRAGAPLGVPFYRCEITGKGDSNQHEMLIELDQAPNHVFYAAPMFHQKGEFDAAFLSGNVRTRSFFVRPRSIGSFADNGAHHLSFDGTRCIVMSEPKEIEALGAADLESVLTAQLAQDKRPLRAVAQEALTEAEAARDRSRDRIERNLRQAARTDGFDFDLIAQAPGATSATEAFTRRQEARVPPVTDTTLPVDPDKRILRQLADIGLREFNAQLYVVQPKGGN
jgi:hypothetical protein